MFQTPAEIIQTLRDRHPDLAAHPTVWADLEQLLIDDRRQLNNLLQEDAGNAVALLRHHLEALLNPPGDDPKQIAAYWNRSRLS